MAVAAAGAVAAAVLPFALELRLAPPARSIGEGWRELPVEPRGNTTLGISFRPLQAEALGLEPLPTLERLLGYPFPLIRLAAYWNRVEPRPGALVTDELDRMLEAAERAGKGEAVAWADTALALGYADQAHLTREFTAMVGFTPGEYARACREGRPLPR